MLFWRLGGIFNRKNEKNSGGNFEIPKMGKKEVGILGHQKKRRVGLLFFCSIERGFNGSRLTLHRGMVLRWVGILNSKKGKKRGVGILNSKNGKKRGVGILGHQKKRRAG